MLRQNLFRSAYNRSSVLRWIWFLFQFMRPYVQPTLWLSINHRRFWRWQQATITHRFKKQPNWRQKPIFWPEVHYLVLPGSSDDLSAHVRALQQLNYPSHLLHITLPPLSESHAALLQGMGFGSVSTQSSLAAAPSSSVHPICVRDRADWCFICPSDCTPSPTALQSAIAASISDRSTACWQLSLGSKGAYFYYDPVTLETSTPSQSCILVSRSTIEQTFQNSPYLGLAQSVFTLTQELVAKRCTLRHLPWATCSRQEQFVPHSNTTQPFTFSEQIVCPNNSSRSIDTPLVSVIMRTYTGRGTLLRQAMQTVFNQSYSHIQLLVIQDGGDDLGSLVNGLAKSAEHIQVDFLSQERLGRSAAGNLGLQQSRGQFIMFLDDDDLLMGEHIETLVIPLVFDPCLSACYAKAVEVYTSYPVEFESYKEIAHRTYSGQPKEWNYANLLQRNFIPIQSILFRRSLYVDLGGFDTQLDQLEDWNLWLRYARGKKFKFIPRITSQFRTPANFRARCVRHFKLIGDMSLAKNRSSGKINHTFLSK